MNKDEVQLSHFRGWHHKGYQAKIIWISQASGIMYQLTRFTRTVAETCLCLIFLVKYL